MSMISVYGQRAISGTLAISIAFAAYRMGDDPIFWFATVRDYFT
jgi:hypothetical protein